MADDVVVALDRQVEHAFEAGVFAVDRRRLDRLETAAAIVLQCSIIIFLPGDLPEDNLRARIPMSIK